MTITAIASSILNEGEYMPDRDDCWRSARAAIVAHTAALAEAGFVIVPGEPIEEMVDAGEQAENLDIDFREQVVRCWRAMIGAAPGEGKP